MVEGGASKEFAHIKSLAYTDPAFFANLIDRLTEAAISYLSMQVEAGVEALQLFESWAGIADADLFHRAIIQPNRKIVQALKKTFPHIPIIGFPRAAGPLVLDYAAGVGADVLALDPQWSPEKMRRDFAAIPCLQGNLDPALLLAGGEAMVRGIDRLKGAMAGRPYVFNLGHGVIKETNPDHVAALVKQVRQA
jgi:uroporphyrinogen decarboxylase